MGILCPAPPPPPNPQKKPFLKKKEVGTRLVKLPSLLVLCSIFAPWTVNMFF